MDRVTICASPEHVSLYFSNNRLTDADITALGRTVVTIFKYVSRCIEEQSDKAAVDHILDVFKNSLNGIITKETFTDFME